MLISPVRSGSTAFLHTISHHPEVETATFLMKKNIFYGTSDDIDYSIYSSLPQKKYLFYKATMGYQSKLECTYNPFRNELDIIETRPLFMFRDPVLTYNSWKKIGWGSLELFIHTYQYVYELYNHAKSISPEIKCITYDFLSKNPSKFSEILEYWGIPNVQNISKWKNKLGENTVNFRADINHKMRNRFLVDIKNGVYDSILKGPQEFCYKHSDIILTNREISIILSDLENIYLVLEKRGSEWSSSATNIMPSSKANNLVRLTAGKVTCFQK